MKLYDVFCKYQHKKMRRHVNHAGQERAKVNQLVGGADKLFIDVFTNTGDTIEKCMHRPSLR